MQAWVAANGLTLHPDKTHLGDCRIDGQGFEFLGYRFEAGKRWVRKKSLMSLKDKIRARENCTPGSEGGDDSESRFLPLFNCFYHLCLFRTVEFLAFIPPLQFSTYLGWRYA